MENVLSGANLQIENISKRFGKHPVLWNFSLDITAGQFVAIVGRSGCGKSTLLRLLAGLEQPTQGEIRVDGRALRQLNRTARVMFQDARLLLWRNVQDNVALGLKHKAKERSLWALQQVGLAARGQDWPAVLSGGQRQRVALARALVGQPQLMLLDEPLGALDALTRMEMQYLIERLWLEQQFTVLLVTHDVEEAVALADRVIMLDEGSVALDLQVNLPRPRDRAAPEFVTFTQNILGKIGLPGWGKVEIPSSISSLS